MVDVNCALDVLSGHTGGHRKALPVASLLPSRQGENARVRTKRGGGEEGEEERREEKREKCVQR